MSNRKNLPCRETSEGKLVTRFLLILKQKQIVY